MLSLCEEGDASGIAKLLEDGKMTPNVFDGDGFSALILGACYGHAEVSNRNIHSTTGRHAHATAHMSTHKSTHGQ